MTVGQNRFALAFAVAFCARALLVGVVAVDEGCTLEEYGLSADGRQLVAVAHGWRGDLDAVRAQGFFRLLRESGGLGSSHLIRFFPAGPGLLALFGALGLPLGVSATLPFWIVASVAAGLGAVWAKDLRVGVLIGLLPPIALYASSFVDGSAWLGAFAISGLLFVRRGDTILAGVAFGLAAWSRPEGFLPAIGMIAGLATYQRRREAWRLGLTATAVASMGVVISVLRFWPLFADILAADGEARAAGPRFLDLPGRSLFQAVASPETPHWKLIYVGVHLAAAILAFLLLLRNATSSGTAANGPERTALSIWLGLQLALALVLRGAQGFDDLPRYVSLATPAIVIAFAPWVVKSRWLVPVLCIASTGLATIPARRNAAPVCADLAMVAEMEDASAIATRRRLRP